MSYAYSEISVHGARLRRITTNNKRRRRNQAQHLMSAAPPSNQDDGVSLSTIVVVPSFHITLILASMYVLSGVTQPLLLEVAKSGGLTDQTCQIYMLAYYMGTASVIILARNDNRLSWNTTFKTGCVASIDIVAQTMNYSGCYLYILQ